MNHSNDTTLYQGALFQLKKRHIDGYRHDWDVIDHPGGAGILLIDDDKVLLVRQYRPAVQAYTLEIPAGKLEPGEDPAKSALRELNEEAGYTCESLSLITAFWPTPGYDTEVIYVYAANHPRRAAERLPMDADEHIELVWMPLCKAEHAIAQGSIKDGKTIIALQHALLERRKKD